MLNYRANVHKADSPGKTPLILAAEKKHLEIVRQLLCATKVTDLWTPLLSAARGGHMELVRGSLNRGATVDIANKNCSTPLYLADGIGHVEVVPLLNNSRTTSI